jgi:hypothetical protein
MKLPMHAYPSRSVLHPMLYSAAAKIDQMNYHIALEERVRKLVSEGREVIVLGTVRKSHNIGANCTRADHKHRGYKHLCQSY